MPFRPPFAAAGERLVENKICSSSTKEHVCIIPNNQQYPTEAGGVGRVSSSVESCQNGRETTSAEPGHHYTLQGG
jgi:hypothetical protein